MKEAGEQPNNGGIVVDYNVEKIARGMGYLACALAVLWAFPHFLFAAHIPGFGATSEAFSELPPGHDITEVVVGSLGLCAALLALALVQRWGRIFPRWMLTVPALIGGVVSGGYGYCGLVYQVLVHAKYIAAPPLHNAVSSGWWLYWYALFAALGTTFVITSWLTRKGRTYERDS